MFGGKPAAVQCNKNWFRYARIYNGLLVHLVPLFMSNFFASFVIYLFFSSSTLPFVYSLTDSRFILQ
jgi:integral membrane sensor domain MASE1